MVSIDFLHLEGCKGGYEYILVVMDHFIWFAQAYACTNKAAKIVAEKIFGDYVLKFGFPTKLHHDRVKNLRTNCSHNWKDTVGYRVHALPHIILL